MADEIGTGNYGWFSAKHAETLKPVAYRKGPAYNLEHELLVTGFTSDTSPEGYEWEDAQFLGLMAGYERTSFRLVATMDLEYCELRIFRSTEPPEEGQAPTWGYSVVETRDNPGGIITYAHHPGLPSKYEVSSRLYNTVSSSCVGRHEEDLKAFIAQLEAKYPEERYVPQRRRRVEVPKQDEQAG